MRQYLANVIHLLANISVMGYVLMMPEIDAWCLILHLLLVVLDPIIVVHPIKTPT